MKINSFPVKELAQNSLLLFSLLLSATLLGSERATAQTATVPFSGSVAPACSVSVTVNGALKEVDSYNLSSLNGGTQGAINVSCNSNAAIQVVSLTPTSTLRAESGTVTVTYPGGASETASTFPLSLSTYPVTSSVFSGTFLVDLTLTNASSILQTGTYSYQVDISFTAQ